MTPVPMDMVVSIPMEAEASSADVASMIATKTEVGMTATPMAAVNAAMAEAMTMSTMQVAMVVATGKRGGGNQASDSFTLKAFILY